MRRRNTVRKIYSSFSGNGPHIAPTQRIDLVLAAANATQTAVLRKVDIDEPTPINALAQPRGVSLVCFSDIRLGSVGFRTETVETITEEVDPKRESNLSVVPHTTASSMVNVHMVHAA